MCASLPSALTDAAERVVAAARSRGCTVATVESCTAGALACLIADAGHATEAFHGGIVVYTKAAKSALVGVSPALLERHTAVVVRWRWPWRAVGWNAFLPMLS
jgi:nicotinamide-nucleotide amidase